MKPAIAVLTILLLAGEASATNVCSVYNYMADFKGTCTKAVFLGKDLTTNCSQNHYSNSPSYGLMRKGLGVFILYLEETGVLWLSGREKTTPDIDNYRLPITLVELPDHKTKPKGKQPAKGECSITKDLNGITIIKCTAVINDGNIEFEARSSGNPDVTDCKEFE